MTIKRLIFGMGTVALAIASAAGSYEFTISQPTWVGTTQLKPGNYSVAVKDGTAVFKSGKTIVEAPASLEKTERKYSATEVDTADSKIKEIHLGGTASKLVFKAGSGADTNAQ